MGGSYRRPASLAVVPLYSMLAKTTAVKIPFPAGSFAAARVREAKSAANVFTY